MSLRTDTATVVTMPEAGKFKRLLAAVPLLLAGATQADPPQPPPAQRVVQLNGREVHVVSRVVDEAGIVEIMKQVGSHAIPLAEPGKPGGSSARCTIDGDASDPRVARLELYCNGWLVEFVRFCDKQPCRYVAASQMYLPNRKPRS